jgi:enoyl-CoA hydratase/carnithine racemase
MCLDGRVATARESVEWGLASRLVETHELRERTRELGESLVAGATQTLGQTRRLLTSERLSAYADHLDDELRTISSLGSNPDTMRRIAAFAERGRGRAKSELPTLRPVVPSDNVLPAGKQGR